MKTLSSIFKGLVFFSAILSQNACIDSNVKGYVDPNYSSSKTSSLIIDMSGLPGSLQYAMEDELSKNLQENNLKFTSINNIILPTRDYTNDEISVALKKSGYQGILTLRLIDTDKDVMVTGSYTNANVSSNGTVSGYSTPFIKSNGIDVFTANLFDTQNLKKIWTGQIITKASGTAFVGKPEQISKSTAKGLIKKLLEENLL